MNETLAMRNIKHIMELNTNELTRLALMLAGLPSFRTALNDSPNMSHNAGSPSMSHARAVMLHDAEADTWARTLSLRDSMAAFELLRSTLYLYAIYYPGIMVAAIDRTK